MTPPRNSIRICNLAGIALLTPIRLLAAETETSTPQPPPTFMPPTSAVSAENMLQLSAGLLAVLALIALTAWLFKRFGMHAVGKAGPLKIVASASVGPKERIVVARIDDIQLVLGVTATQINLLHQKNTVDMSAAAPLAAESPSSNFAQTLQTELESKNHDA